MTTRVFLQSPLLPDMVVFTIDASATAADLKEKCLAQLPEAARSASLDVSDEFEADAEREADEVEAGGEDQSHSAEPKSRRVHIGRCKRVKVSVRYAGRTVEREFRPAATIKRVTAWAIRKLHISPGDAHELVLQVAGSDVQPSSDKHVGLFVDDHCRAVFDLVRGYTVNGDSSPPAGKIALLSHVESAPFLSGVDSGKWSLHAIEWPTLLVNVMGPGGATFTLRLDCDGYPQQAPSGAFWDLQKDTWLPGVQWPRSDGRGGQALRSDWRNGTALYIPCDRESISGHDQWQQLHPAWLWSPTVGIVRYLNVVWHLMNGSHSASLAA
jgi:hypothetical protein